jgi:hypothetical protein
MGLSFADNVSYPPTVGEVTRTNPTIETLDAVKAL